MKKLSAAIAGTAVAVLLVAAPAAAHVEPTVQEVPAGSYATVEFTVEHGCDGSPTVRLEFQIPEELTDVTPVEQAGWSTSVSGGIVTFEGGPLAPDVEADFAVQFTVPEQQGATLTFPFIQTCEEGSIDWIQQGSDAERPAPTVTIGAPDPSAPTPPATTSTVPSEVSTTTTVETSTTQGIAPITEVDPEAAETEDADQGASPWLAIGGVVLVTAAVVGTVIYLRSREK
jgi:uncharacterized protein YcnI